jgi:hypothetical protein
MKTAAATGLLLVVLMTSTLLHAQPAKDLFDAQQAAKQHERDLQPALGLVRETAGVLRILLEVERTLGNNQLPAGSAVDRAIRLMDEYDRDMQKRQAIFPSDIRRRLGVARNLLDQSRGIMPADLPLLRDRWHHDVIHPIARRVAEDAQAVNTLIATYTLIENNLRQLQSTQLGVLAGAENVPGLPGATPQP